jgi:hypothetical protein
VLEGASIGEIGRRYIAQRIARELRLTATNDGQRILDRELATETQ